MKTAKEVAMKSISERIVEGMAIRNMKQVDIIEATGINKGSLSSYISGKYEPKQTNIFKIAKALNVNEAWLMGHDVPMERTLKNTNNKPNYDNCNRPLSHQEKSLLHKYRSIDTKGKHTINTVLEMEYIRCNPSSNTITNVEAKITNDKSFVEPVAAHERTDIEVTEEMKKYDDAFFDE
jgi:transcriptional regulator with XRE-family HTH domain